MACARPTDDGSVDQGVWRALLRQQGGSVARSQLTGADAQPHDIERMLRRRELVRVLPGVFVDHTGPLTWTQRTWAGVLHAWPAALDLESGLWVAGQDATVGHPARRRPRPASPGARWIPRAAGPRPRGTRAVESLATPDPDRGGRRRRGRHPTRRPGGRDVLGPRARIPRPGRASPRPTSATATSSGTSTQPSAAAGPSGWAGDRSSTGPVARRAAWAACSRRWDGPGQRRRAGRGASRPEERIRRTWCVSSSPVRDSAATVTAPLSSSAP